ncbi:MAG: phosphodiester glycosidase family protein [Flavobacterium sp.]|uniref:phosphodiester glycosidase family protein n=1 Tax=Flavobacterium sp. TaxID=239 RepID=UPI00326703E8
MKRKHLIIISLLIVCTTLLLQFVWKGNADERFVSYVVNPKKQSLALYWKDNKQMNFASFQNLKTDLNKNRKELLFAMNGGMYKKDKSPQGLFIQEKNIKSQIDTGSGDGNFYLKPNGIFYLTTTNKAVVCKTEDFVANDIIKYATQSGPMLVINGETHSAFTKGSARLNIRNGVGILPDGQVLFAMSKKEINFYDFAEFFKSKGCKNALYLDGFVSRAYCPSQNWIQTDGDFGVIIAVTKKMK